MVVVLQVPVMVGGLQGLWLVVVLQVLGLQQLLKVERRVHIAAEGVVTLLVTIWRHISPVVQNDQPEHSQEEEVLNKYLGRLEQIQLYTSIMNGILLRHLTAMSTAIQDKSIMKVKQKGN